VYGVSEDIAHRADADAAWREMVDSQEETPKVQWDGDLMLSAWGISAWYELVLD